MPAFEERIGFQLWPNQIKHVGVAVMLDGEFFITGSFSEVFSSTEPTIKTFYDYNFITNQ